MPLSIDFAFEGFRLIRERPKLIPLWGVVTLFGNSVASIVLVAMAGVPLLQLKALQDKGGTPDMTVLQGLVEASLPGMAAAIAIYLVTMAVVATAACRAVAGRDGQDDSLGFLRFGLDELRLLVVCAVMAFVNFGVMVVAMTLGTLLGAAGPTAGVLLGGMLVVWLSVRLSLNQARTFATGRIDVFGSFKLTREVFWPLAGGYVMAFALAAVVWFLCNIIVSAVVMAGFGSIGDADLTSLTAFLTGQTIVDLVFSGLITLPLTTAILYSAPAAAYRALAGETRESVF